MTRNYQSIRTNYWDQARNRPEPLTADELLIEIYLVTCPQCGPSGAYTMNPTTIEYYTGILDSGKGISDLWGKGKVEGILDGLQKKGRIKTYPGGWIWVIGKWEFESKNPNVQKALFLELETAPGKLVAEFLDRYEDTLTERVPDRVSDRVSHTYPETKLEINKKQSNNKDMSPKKGDAAKPEKETAPSRIITDAYQDCYLKEFKKKPTWGSPEGKRVQELLKRFDGDANRIAALIKLAFTCDDEFIAKVRGSFLTLTAAAIITKLDAMEAPTEQLSLGETGFVTSA